MMKYQPINLNFIPKDDKSKKTPSSGAKGFENLPSSNDSPEIELKQMTPLFTNETFSLEDKNMMRDQIKVLTEQLDFSVDHITTLEEKLKDSTSQIASLTEQLNHYELLKKDLDQVSALNTSMSKLAKENEVLKQELTQKKDHVQMLYLMLLVLVIL